MSDTARRRCTVEVPEKYLEQAFRLRLFGANADEIAQRFVERGIETVIGHGLIHIEPALPSRKRR